MTLPEKRKRRGRDPNQLLRCLPPADIHGNTMLLWGSQEWEPRKLKGFEEDLDSTEYHDATEEPTRKEESEEPQLPLKPGGISGGCGSSSLKECIELLNATVRNSPAPLDSGAGSEIAVPPHYPRCSPKSTE